MSLYNTGTARLITNSQVVKGTDTVWSTNISRGDILYVDGEIGYYQIAGVLSDTIILLADEYPNASQTTASYNIISGFTQDFSLPEIHTGDTQQQYYLTTAITMVDEDMYNILGTVDELNREWSTVTIASLHTLTMTASLFSIASLPYDSLGTTIALPAPATAENVSASQYITTQPFVTTKDGMVSKNTSYVTTYIANKQTFTNLYKWEQVSISTVLGAEVTDAFEKGCFDGRYIYFSPKDSDTFIRFDTTGVFTDSTKWETISMSTAQGAATLNDAYNSGVFDGRYVYFAPLNSDRFLRFDTIGVFTNSTNWQKMSTTTAGVGGADSKYKGCTFDGKYIYYSPNLVQSFTRFDTTGDFTNSNMWEKIDKSSAKGSKTTSSYSGALFDGRYIYFSMAYSASNFIRFDTTGTFTSSNSWETMSISSVFGRPLSRYYVWDTIVFDGRYLYFIPVAGCTFIDAYLRFDTTGNFTSTADWETLSLTSGGSSGGAFDGRYVYYNASNPLSNILRFDTNGSFSDTTDWTSVVLSSIVGGSFISSMYKGAIYDGKYIYFVPSASKTFIRYLATETNLGFGKFGN